MNPYQEVIDWLRSPDGEQWSEDRMRKAFPFGSPADFAFAGIRDGCPVALVGVFSIKED